MHAIPLLGSFPKLSCKPAYTATYNPSNSLVRTIDEAFNSDGLPVEVATSFYDATTPVQQQVWTAFDQWDNAIEKDETDFFPCSGSPCSVATPTTWLRKTFTTYAYTTNSTLAGKHIVNKPSHVLITDGSGKRFSLTDYGYDNNGNVTDEYKCIAISGTGSLPSSDTVPSASCTTYWQTHYVYDSTGQITTKTEGYNNAKAATTTYTWSGLGDGYLYNVKYPNGAEDSYAYEEENTGLITSHTDWNGQKTTYSYTDPVTNKGDLLVRIHKITAPQMMDMTTGSLGNGTTTYTYNDVSGAFSVQEQHTVDASSTQTSKTTNFDGLGRVSTVTTEVSAAQCSGGNTTVLTTYDLMGRLYSVSNPYCSASDPTYGTTSYEYDALGRKIQTILPDGAISTIKYGGNATEVSDPFNGATNVQHIQQRDGLGRLTDVCEVSSTPLGSDASPTACNLKISGTGYLTQYTYDAVGNLLTVSQHGQSRTFNYDALSRLLCASNPENTTASCPSTPSGTWVNGTIGYTFSAEGPDTTACAPDPMVPCTRTDARGVLTMYGYDNMSRLISKSYMAASGNTIEGSISDLSACYQYDAAFTGFPGVTDTNPLGQLTGEWEQAGSCPAQVQTSISSGMFAIRLRYNHDAMGTWDQITNARLLPLARPRR